MLKIANLNAGYENMQILKNINVHVKPNEIVALIGPNGAGKSTILKAIFNLAEVTNGNIFFNEKDVTKKEPHTLIKQGICYVNQGRIIFGSLTVFENIMIGVDAKDPCAKEKREKIYKQFPILREKRKLLAFSLSGGERQQLALARVLMQEPKLLLLDEPSLGLSPKLQKEVFETIKKLKQDMSILIVEQNAKKAIEIADRTYLLEEGSIVLEGGKEIIENKKIKEVYLGG